MNDLNASTNGGNLAAPLINTRRRRLSTIWLIPLLAAMIGLYLGWMTLSEKGPQITITLRTAEGLEPGKTQIRYKAIVFGTVKTIALTPDGSHVIVTAEMTRQAEPLLRENSQFWVVQPRLSASSGISGLSTIVSGVYIEFDPGKKSKPAESFVALDAPPVVPADAAGTEFLLKAKHIGSIGAGSPIFYRGFQVGEVLGYDSSNLDHGITIRAFVRAPYDKQVQAGTSFWNASGVSLTTGPQGFRLQLDSIQALLAGGIAFDTLSTAPVQPTSSGGTAFTLYKDQASADEAKYTIRLKYLVYFDSSVGGLAPGSNVEWHGLKIGQVIDVKLQYDLARNTLRAPVLIEIEPQRAEIVGADDSIDPEELIKSAVAKGLRAQLRTSNYLTGQAVVALEMDPKAHQDELGTGDTYPVIPTDPSQFDSTLRSVNGILDRISKMPLDQLVSQATDTLKSVQDVAERPEIKDSLNSLTEALGSASELIQQAKLGLGPALEKLAPTLERAQQAMIRMNTSLNSFEQGYGKSSSFKRDMTRLISQINDTMRSFRVIADYLQQHPEALIRGKTTGNN
ncbi:MCE family protein [Brucella pituitosa]|uniref:PqiB family protein n=1 Tax=Brucella pituitosa TaxID=571256 RepID=UPI0020040FE7|nr:MlaD family protein [Brucella pituitosa]MCK4207638.1 MCE family protein [Brucella pituitosa]